MGTLGRDKKPVQHTVIKIRERNAAYNNNIIDICSNNLFEPLPTNAGTADSGSFA
jgi:hypothetical protein